MKPKKWTDETVCEWLLQGLLKAEMPMGEVYTLCAALGVKLYLVEKGVTHDDDLKARKRVHKKGKKVK